MGYFSTVKSGGRSYSGNSHSAPQSDGYDKAVLNENTQYQAVLTGGSRTDNKNNVFCFITINGKRADTVRKSDLPDDMKSLPAEKLKGRIICVVCTGKKETIIGIVLKNNMMEVESLCQKIIGFWFWQ